MSFLTVLRGCAAAQNHIASTYGEGILLVGLGQSVTASRPWGTARDYDVKPLHALGGASAILELHASTRVDADAVTCI